MKDVLRRITEATALLGQAEDVCIETVDPPLNEVTCVAGRGEDIPVAGAKGTYVGSLAQEVLHGGLPRIIENVDLEGQPDHVCGGTQRADSRGHGIDCAAPGTDG